MTPLESKIENIILPVIEGEGYRLVRVRAGDGVMEVMAENPETQNLGVDECARLSRAISAVMDVEDPISGKYRLEISSPGIDRPLVSLEDYVIYQGFEVKIERKTPSELGQKKYRGHLKSIENETDIVVKTDEGDAIIPFDAIAKAKLVLTDELIQKTSHKRVKPENNNNSTKSK